MTKYCPLITCRLTDWEGRRISPYDPGSIVYTVLSSSGNKENCGQLPVAIEGYVTVYSDEKRISPPIPFCILESVSLSIPKGGRSAFKLKSFHCWAIPCPCEKSTGSEWIKLLISMDTVCFAEKAVSLLVPQVDSLHHEINRICICTNQIFDHARFFSGCCLSFKNTVLTAEISQYSTISDGTKRTYLDSDEMKEYGNQGILSPTEVSYYDVFVNGVMQPKTTYVLKKGELTFTTQDIPLKGQPVMILFTTWKNIDGQIMEVTDYQYNAVSNGVKKIYTDEDELKEYGHHGIPSPCDMSYFNFYSNGVLQPQVSYQVRKGVLELTTADAPVKGAPVILESIAIHDSLGHLFRAETYNYNAHSNGGKIYTNQDEIRMYGKNGISDPNASFYQNLFVNAVLQPDVNYIVQKGYLILDTEDSPTEGAPITLQSVKGSCAPLCCETQMSDAARAQWNKIYGQIKDTCAPTQFQQENKSE